ncbi:MAG: hypothetical protein KTR29_10020 [Rhodothermaceae bacterium]|nr:hypothetical protein [Rhodothermaceae bacterium]
MRIPTSSTLSLCALLVFGLVLAGCDSVVDAEQDVALTAPAVAYDLEVGNSLAVEPGVTVEFIELLSDTRCPLEEVCQNKGSVEASFILEMDGKRAPFVLGGYVGPEGKEKVRFDVGPYEVIMERLDPYPMEDCDMDMPPIAKLQFQK